MGGVLHLICALALMFYYATSWGVLLIVLGHIYRDYGYVQLANAVFYLGLFVYFIGCLKPQTVKA
jgi:ABC-type polysaccharide/polyol phosphate export permease